MEPRQGRDASARLAALSRHGVVCASECLRTELPVNAVNKPRDLVYVAIREGVPEDRTLETVTTNPAAILEVSDRVGSLEPGKDADFLLFQGDPWDGRNKVDATYIDGAKVFESDGPYLPD